MPGWKSQRSASFDDMPKRLVDARDDTEQLEWLERHELSLVDFFSWRRAQDPSATKRPPARRKLLTQRERAELDLEREIEDFEW